jgi:hypothetical protein
MSVNNLTDMSGNNLTDMSGNNLTDMSGNNLTDMSGNSIVLDPPALTIYNNTIEVGNSIGVTYIDASAGQVEYVHDILHTQRVEYFIDREPTIIP